MKRTSQWTALLAVLGLMLGLLGSVQAADTKGTVKSVAAEKHEMVLTVMGSDYTFQVPANAKVTIGKQPGKLNDLKAGDPVTASYAQASGKLVITAIARP